MLTPGRFERLLGVLQTHECLWGAARTALFGLAARGLQMRLYLLKLFLSFGGSLVGSSLFDGHRRGDGLAEFTLHMEEVR
jgi:hypothetical protein